MYLSGRGEHFHTNYVLVTNLIGYLFVWKNSPLQHAFYKITPTKVLVLSRVQIGP